MHRSFTAIANSQQSSSPLRTASNVCHLRNFKADSIITSSVKFPLVGWSFRPTTLHPPCANFANHSCRVFLPPASADLLISSRDRFSSPLSPGHHTARRYERRPKRSVIVSDMRRKVALFNSNGERLAGILDDTKSRELVVLCHGFRSSKDSGTLAGIAELVSKTGISTFRFDFAGNGESEGEFAYGNYWREVEDLRSVILHWRAEGRDVTAIIGHSKGGNVVVLYASKYGDVNTVINVSGRFDLEVGIDSRFGKGGMEKLKEKGYLDVKNKEGVVEYRVTLESLKDRLETDMDAASKAISKDVRVLTIHGEVDEIVAVANAYEFARRIPNHVLRIIAGGNHNYEGTQPELSTIVLEFLQGKLSKI